ncbi:MAG TPA: GNAT family N-acetyltransferase [Jatrophihabitantaceae bacterium]|jgi:GNAT superfamily N-acetyltransferase
MPEILIRDASSDDYAAMARIFRHASLANPGDREALLAHPHALQLPDDLIRSGHARVAMLADGTMVGFASTRPIEIGVIELEDLFVDPGWQRQGAARRLMQQITAEACEETITRIEVTANPHALEFYRAAGFVAESETQTEFGPGLRMHLDVRHRATRDPDQRNPHRAKEPPFVAWPSSAHRFGSPSCARGSPYGCTTQNLRRSPARCERHTAHTISQATRRDRERQLQINMTNVLAPHRWQPGSGITITGVGRLSSEGTLRP